MDITGQSYLGNNLGHALDTVRQSELDKQIDNAGKIRTKEEVDKTAKQFEGMFMAQILNTLFKEVDLDPLTENGMADDIYKSMLLDEYGELLSERGVTGIGDAVAREMLKLQEV